MRSPLDKAKPHEVVWAQVAPLFDAVRGLNGISFVYFIGEEDGPVKIGLAKDPIARIRTMQTGNPRPLRVERLLLGDMAAEKLLHELWGPFAIRSVTKRGKVGCNPGTEWFRAEVRTGLYPIIEAAAAQQAEVAGLPGGETFLELERVVRAAHKESGFVAQGRDEVRLLANGAGYTGPRRPSRI